jgi:hypothetical protein
VRGGGGQDERFGVRREHPGELVVHGLGIGDVVGLVNDYRVPVQLAELGPVAGAFQRIHRDDGALVVREGIARGRDFLPDLLDAGGVEADERQGKPAPELMLHLFQHVARGNDEDAFAAAAFDQLAEDHADLEGLAEAHRVRDQDARPDVLGVQGLRDGDLLVLEVPRQHAGGDRQILRRLGCRRLAKGGLQEEPCAAVVGSVIGDDGGLWPGPRPRWRPVPSKMRLWCL